MPWTIDGSGLRYEGEPHWNVSLLNDLMDRLSEVGQGNNPGPVCSDIREVMASHRATFDHVKRLSKWCDWNNERAVNAAQRIAKELFRHVCKRLTERASDTLLPDAWELYEVWRERVVSPPTSVLGRIMEARRKKAEQEKNQGNQSSPGATTDS